MEGFYLPSNIDADPGINGHALEMDFVENMNLSEPVRRLTIFAAVLSAGSGAQVVVGVFAINHCCLERLR